MRSKSKYTVCINGLMFGFDDGVNAINLADVAMEHFIPGEYIKTLEVTVYLKGKPVEDVKEENNDDDEQ